MTDNLSGVELKMARCKTELVLRYPFYATLALSMEWVRVPADHPEIQTMATDGERYYWNEGFVEKMSLDECRFVICHEIMHCVFMHMNRLAGRDPYRWNVATDYVINDMLVADKVGTMPKGGLLNPQIVIAGKHLAENVYALLPEMKENSKGGADGKGGNPLDKLMKPKGGQAEQNARANAMKVKVAQAASAAKMAGNLSANLERIVGSVLKPKVCWKDVLRQFVSARAKTDASYARPKRRFLGEDLYLPSLSGESMGPLAIAVDCSGSIGDKELSEFRAEILAIAEDCRPSSIDVVYFDSMVCHHDHYERDDEPNIVGHGGGGTAFSPIFKFLDEKCFDLTCCVVLTDLYCDDFGPPPAYPVLWVTTGAEKAPWGQIVSMK